MSQARLKHLQKFYWILARLEDKIGGARKLVDCDGRLPWPKRGVYFFMEAGETRKQSGDGLRIVRVGTHATRPNSRTSLWGRLRQHRGDQRAGGGNHRASIFRLIVGTALIGRDHYYVPSWDTKHAPRESREAEAALERKVSEELGAFKVLWVAVEDEPSPQSLRDYIERNAVALLSNYGREAIDPPSPAWLGHFCNRERVCASALWNSNYVDLDYDPAFLDRFEQLVLEMEGRR